MPQAALRVENLKKSFQSKAILRGMRLELGRGQLGVVIGRSGSGKSTLLRCLNGLEKPDAGAIHLHGYDLAYPCDGDEHPLIHDVRQRVGMVFQDFNLFPHLDLLNNVALAPRLTQAKPREEAEQLAAQSLGQLGLAEHVRHFPSQVSGGQAQRAAIARALALEPEILLYDEPTASLDPRLTHEVLEAMLALKKRGMTQLVVTHEHAFALKAADRVFFVDDGVVVESGPARQVLKAPKHPLTRAFVKGKP